MLWINILHCNSLLHYFLPSLLCHYILRSIGMLRYLSTPILLNVVTVMDNSHIRNGYLQA